MFTSQTSLQSLHLCRSTLELDSFERPARGQSKTRQRAILLSVAFHVVAGIVLLFWYVPRHQAKSSSERGAATPASIGDPSRAKNRADDYGIPQPKESVEVTPEEIEASLQTQMDAVERLTDEQKLDELEKNLKRLDAISTTASVRQVTDTIADSLGLEPGNVPLQEPVDGAFDPDTAQLHDVEKVADESGGVRYESVLVDSKGRIQRVPMSVADGETAYSAFEQMKRYPMAAGIYRQIVMPLVQRMIEASEAAEHAARVAEENQHEQQGNVGVLPDPSFAPLNGQRTAPAKDD